MFFTTANHTSVPRFLHRLVSSMHRNRQVIIMQELQRLLVYQIDHQDSRTTRLRYISTIELPEALDFIGESSAWQFLTQKLALSSTDNTSLILHPALYVLHNAAAQSHGAYTAFFDSTQLTQQSVPLEQGQLIYSCHASVSASASDYRSIIPWAEVVRLLAATQQLPITWLIANTQYLWMTDALGRLYESAMSNTDYVRWLIAQLLSSATSSQKYRVIVDCEATAQQLPLHSLQVKSTCINQSMQSIEAMLDLLIQSHRSFG